MKRVSGFLRHHMTTRKKEMLLGLLLWGILLVLTSDISPSVFWAICISLQAILTISTCISLANLSNEKGRSPLFVHLLLKPYKNKPMALFFAFLAFIVIDIIGICAFPKGEAFRYLSTAFLGFSGVAFWEILEIWRRS